MRQLYKDSILFRYLIIWYIITLAFALLISLASGGYLFLSLALWTVIAVIAYYLRPPNFIISGLVLALIEETLIYSLGGGLQGEATSLADDLIHAMPVFAAIVIGWYLCLVRYDIQPQELYLLGGLHGVLLELVLSGLILNPIIAFLFGGSTIFIYGSILISPQQPHGDAQFTTSTAIKWWFIILILIVFSGIVSNQLNNLIRG